MHRLVGQSKDVQGPHHRRPHDVQGNADGAAAPGDHVEVNVPARRDSNDSLPGS